MDDASLLDALERHNATIARARRRLDDLAPELLGAVCRRLLSDHPELEKIAWQQGEDRGRFYVGQATLMVNDVHWRVHQEGPHPLDGARAACCAALGALPPAAFAALGGEELWVTVTRDGVDVSVL